ncbi:hypothetical protein R5R35_008306 [Gryllus longicercus]|uniref:Accessory gland protein n=1 Tax=Gryllus longicercus TaxID=2509291 RepID=A0AAN9VVV9_9ORTH
MRTTFICAGLLCAWALLAPRAAGKPKPIMVWSGKLSPIMPALPTPPPPVPYPPVPPAPVWEDPEPGFNNLLTYPSRGAAKFGFRVKPLKTYAFQKT